ncbi:hypothetical protein [Fontibacillus sp. BL9]|uniref:hypothetical protein n=1 Tax=Fontibacillus sp. BL9 TaxID=3389971 RepID=UPI00397DADAB
MQNTKKIRKPWWVSKSTALLQEYAHTARGTYVPGSFKDWKYTGQHVKIPLGHGLGTIIVTVTDSGSGSSNQLVVGMKYSYSPRRKLEFHLCKLSRPLFLPFHPQLRHVTLPNTAMNKQFHAKASHPSLLRSILKQDGLHEELEAQPSAYIKLQPKKQMAILSLDDTSKTPDAHMLDRNIKLMKHFIAALHEQGYIREKIK